MSEEHRDFPYLSWDCVRCGHLIWENVDRAESVARWHQDRYGDKHRVRLVRYRIAEEVEAP